MNIPVEVQLGCHNAPFLTDVLQAYEADGSIVGIETTLAVRGLKHAIRSLRDSNLLYEKITLEEIDQNFWLKEYVGISESGIEDHIKSGSITKALTKANRQQIVDFGFWYHSRIAYLGKQLVEDQAQLAEDTMYRTEVLANKNLIPKSAVSIMEQSIEWAGPFKPIGSIEQIALSSDAYCLDDGIAIANLYDVPELPAMITPELRQTVFHEFVHGVGTMNGGRRGLFYGILVRNKDIYERWLEEATVAELAHSAASIGSNQKNLVRLSKFQPYVNEREFLKLLMQASRDPLTFEDINSALFTARLRRSLPRQFVHSTLSKVVNSIFPEHDGKAWEVINSVYELKPHRRSREKYMATLVDKAKARTSKAKT